MTLEEMRATEDAVALEWFETLVLNQRPASKPWAPVTDYSFEARKAIEGKHPVLIKEVFRPKTVLDAGCGPGHMVRLLREIGVKAEGRDAHRWPEWRDAALDAHCEEDDIADVPFGYYDLVMCREVLEHMRVLDIRQTIVNLCCMARKFVYVTTRFHPHPPHLLAVATSDNLDPTHISMLNQTLLRVLFVLEGFKRRADLEEQLDWMKKGRCLVYERV